MLSSGDIQAILLTLKLAATVTGLLLLVGTPLAWWLVNTRSKFRAAAAALIALPLVLPPTVIGFYLLLAYGPAGPIGRFTAAFDLPMLAFSFWGLVIASMVYSLPFVVQPLQSSMESVNRRALEAAATLGAGPLDRFISVVLPHSKVGFIGAAILGFAHTVGEFGVVLMIGGNIPGETRVASLAIYDHVEALEYSQAHGLAAVMMMFAFVVLLALYSFGRAPLMRGQR